MTSSSHGGRRYLHRAFTEHGAIMAAMLIRSPRAVTMRVQVARTFLRMREELATSAIILKRLAEIDKRQPTHDVVLRDIYTKLLPLLSPPPPPAKELGFHTRPARP